MRALVGALALALVAGSAAAQMGPAITGGGVPVPAPRPNVPAGVKTQAEDLVKQNVPNPDSIMFKNVRVDEAESVRHGFGGSVDGPISVVCGQYQVKDKTGAYGGYAWFFIPIKHGQVLWSDLDDVAAGKGDGYYACKGAGLAE